MPSTATMNHKSCGLLLSGEPSSEILVEGNIIVVYYLSLSLVVLGLCVVRLMLRVRRVLSMALLPFCHFDRFLCALWRHQHPVPALMEALRGLKMVVRAPFHFPHILRL